MALFIQLNLAAFYRFNNQALSSQLVKIGSWDYSSESSIILLFGIIKLAIHFTGISNYGFHSDELYYISLSNHFKWGFLDISPFVTWIAKISIFLFGSGIIGLRIVPCLFSAATIMLTGHITRILGGAKFAIVIACSAMLCSPAFLATSYLLQPVVFDEFFWTLFAYAIINYQLSRNPAFLYLASFSLGLGMLNKYTILIYLSSLILGLILVAPKCLKSLLKNSYGAILLFAVILLPNLLWQWAHGFPIFHYLNVVGAKVYAIDIPDYLFQLFFFHGAGVAVWTAGFVFLIFSDKQTKVRWVWPISFLIAVILMAVLKGKLYYILGIFPLLFAAGGICWEMMLEQSTKIVKTTFVVMLYVFALFSFPLVIPVLSKSSCRNYIAKMVDITNFLRPMRWEDGTQGTIPQFFADMEGWKRLTLKVEKILRTRKAELSKNTIILTDDYAVAGALKFYGQKEFPEVISVTNSFVLNAPNIIPKKAIIYFSKEPIVMVCRYADEVELVESLNFENSHLNGLSIYLLKGINANLQAKNWAERQAFLPSR